MLVYHNKGTTIEIKLPGKLGKEGYSVECRYVIDPVSPDGDKYLLSMWLNREDVCERMKIDYQEIDTQKITSSKESIKRNICMIVEQAYKSGFFDSYVSRYEYTLKCFDRGNELFEMERMSGE